MFIKTEASLLSGFLTMLVTYPFDLARTRVAVDLGKSYDERMYHGIFDFFKKTLKNEGILTFYKGFSVACLGIVPYIIVAFSTFDSLKEYVFFDRKYKENQSAQAIGLKLFGIGIVSGLIAQFVTYPIDTIRRRLQINGLPNSSTTYKSIFDCIRTMIQQEGIFGFYGGVGASLLRVGPTAAMQFMIFDLCKYYLFEINI